MNAITRSLQVCKLVSSLEAVLFATVCLGIHQSRDCTGTGLPGESSKHQTTTFLSLLPNEYLRYDSDDSHRKAPEKINSVFIAGFEYHAVNKALGPHTECGG